MFAINPPSPARPVGSRGSLWDMPYAGPVDHATGDGLHGRGDRARPRAGGGRRRRRGRRRPTSPRSTAAVPTARWRWSCTSRAPRRSTRACRRSTPGTPPACARSDWSGAGPARSATACPSASPPRRTPDPGLTDAGRALVRRCAELGILVDLSHLNAAGFADVARLAAAPLVASHTACHALCASTRNLTDDQLREIGAQRRHRRDRLRAGLRARGRRRRRRHAARRARGPRAPRRRRSPASITWGWARTSTARRCPRRSATSPACRACSTRCATTASAPTRCERIAWGNWRRVLGSVWGSSGPTPRAAARTRRCRPPGRARRRAGAGRPRA